MGLDIYLYEGKESVEEKSDKYPEHYCNKGYLRSSYNSAGFNSVIGSMIGKDLHYIIQPIEKEFNQEDEDASWFVEYSKEHLKEALERAKEVTKEIKEAPPFKVSSIDATDPFGDKPTPIQEIDDYQAIQIFNLTKKGEKLPFKSEVLEVPMICRAFIKGVTETNNPAVHIIYEDGENHKCKTVAACEKLDGLFKNKKQVTEKRALEIFEEHAERQNGEKKGFGSYSNGEGNFYFDEPIKAHAFIPGTGILKNPAIHVVFEMNDDAITYYVQQAEIIEEFLEKALTLKDPRIGWSG